MSRRSEECKRLFRYEKAILELVETQGFFDKSQVRRLRIQFGIKNNNSSDSDNSSR